MEEPTTSYSQDGDTALPPGFNNDGTLRPDHPLLQRAQHALSKQLETRKYALDGELRERQNALQKAKQQREAVGVELYGFQQSLAKLQTSLESAQNNYQTICAAREKAEQELSRLKRDLETASSSTKAEQQRSEALQRELDRLGATLRQVEAYNESMKSEIAVTRRAAYAAEGAVQRLEKEKMSQDYLINDMQENIRALQQQADLYAAQLQSQARETRAARETLAEAEAEIAEVQFDKKQLLAQWRSVLTAVQRRDEALNAIEKAINEQHEQELTMAAEIKGFQKDIVKEQIRNEQLTSIVNKVGGEAEMVAKQTAALVERQEVLAAQVEKLNAALAATEERVKKAQAEGKALNQESDHVQRAIGKVYADIRDLEATMLRTLSEQTTAEKSSSKTTADIKALQQAALQEELRIAGVQNELAKLQVDILNTEAHNKQLEEAQQLLDSELTDKEAAIAKCETSMKKRGDEIERKTRDIDTLNRKLERIVASRPEAVETGPLEATIASLNKEIVAKGEEGKTLQQRWINKQGELVAMQAENDHTAETLARRKAETTVLQQKLGRLQTQLRSQLDEAKSLQTASGRLHVDLQRINSLIAGSGEAQALLKEENLQLEGRAMAELRALEEEAAGLSRAIDEAMLQKRQLLDEVVEGERQVLLLERKLQLEREMQEVLDPSVGVGLVSAMRQEVHRMELRKAELARQTERLMQELDRAVSKYEIIGVKAQAAASKKSKPGSMAAQERLAQRALTDLQRQLRDTEKEAAALQERLVGLADVQQQLSANQGSEDAAVAELRQQQEQLRQAAEAAAQQKLAALLSTTRLQRLARRYEELLGGKYKAQVEDKAALPSEIQKAASKQQRLVALLQQLQQQHPALAADLQKVLAHAAIPAAAAAVAAES